MTREERTKMIRVRAIREAEYILDTYANQNEAGLLFGVSASTVSKDMKRLKEYDEELYSKVKNIFKYRRRRFKKRKQYKIYFGVYIYGTKKGIIRKREFFARNEKIPYTLTKSGRYWMVCAPLYKYGECSEKEMNELFMAKINELKQLEKIN